MNTTPKLPPRCPAPPDQKPNCRVLPACPPCPKGSASDADEHDADADEYDTDADEYDDGGADGDGDKSAMLELGSGALVPCPCTECKQCPGLPKLPPRCPAPPDQKPNCRVLPACPACPHGSVIDADEHD